MRIFIGLLSIALLVAILWDAFETVILPRRVTRTFRLARLFFGSLWLLHASIARRISATDRRESYLSSFGPLSLLVLFALWAGALIFAFALLQWAAGSEVGDSGTPARFLTDLYFSGTTFFTLGLGDVAPRTEFARVVAVMEAGIGFGFLAIVITYFPTLYTSFSQRETNISLLDARAGSPPTAGELLRRHGRQRIADGLGQYLHDWEAWAAQLMESHLTYPILCFFRSQHDNQSWVAALTAVLDVCALLIAYGDGETKRQAQLTFAISRHAVADLSLVLKPTPHAPHTNRLPPEDVPRLRGLLVQCGVPGCADSGDAKLSELRSLYEPHLVNLSHLLLMPLPSWGVDAAYGWETSMWGRITSAKNDPLLPHPVDRDHF